MADLSPRLTLELVSQAIPDTLRGQFVVVGSVAAGYQFFGDDEGREVRTKDIDSVLAPAELAVDAGRTIAEQLLGNGWTHVPSDDHIPPPGKEDTPDDQLPVIRLRPPSTNEWFLELLGEPAADDTRPRSYQRVILNDGHFALARFRFLRVATFNPVATPMGVLCARPSMMALANLLSHPKIGPERMASALGGRSIKRANKDLGRVLAMARLAGVETFAEGWLNDWKEALASLFPSDQASHVKTLGAGLVALLESESDLDEALHTCNQGLLARSQITIEELRGVGKQLLRFAIEPLGGEVEPVARPKKRSFVLDLKPKTVQIPEIGELSLKPAHQLDWPDKPDQSTSSLLRELLATWLHSESIDTPQLRAQIDGLRDKDVLKVARHLASAIFNKPHDDLSADALVKRLRTDWDRRQRMVADDKRAFEQMTKKLLGPSLIEEALQSPLDRAREIVEGPLARMQRQIDREQDMMRRAGLLNQLADNDSMIELARTQAQLTEWLESPSLIAVQENIDLLSHQLSAVSDNAGALSLIRDTQAFHAIEELCGIARFSIETRIPDSLAGFKESIAGLALDEASQLAQLARVDIDETLFRPYRWYLDAIGAAAEDLYVDPITEYLESLDEPAGLDDWRPPQVASGFVQAIDTQARSAVTPEAKKSTIDQAVSAATRYHELLLEFVSAFHDFHERAKRGKGASNIIDPHGTRLALSVAEMTLNVSRSEVGFGEFCLSLYQILVESTTHANRRARVGFLGDLRTYRDHYAHNPNLKPEAGRDQRDKAVGMANRTYLGIAWPQTSQDWYSLQCALLERGISMLRDHCSAT